MPWSDAQRRTAQAVEHGWTPKGSAKNFGKMVKGRGKSLAELIVEESPKNRKRRKYGL